MTGLEKFIHETSPTKWINKSPQYEYGFALLRWSKELPCWCVFACELFKQGISGIGGHYCLAVKANLHNVLDTLISSGCPVRVYQVQQSTTSIEHLAWAWVNATGFQCLSAGGRDTSVTGHVSYIHSRNRMFFSHT